MSGSALRKVTLAILLMAAAEVHAAITVWQHRFNWANFVSDDRQQLGWMVTAAIHAGATLLNARSLSKG